MQGVWGWGTFKPHSSEAPNRPWQGQWESHGCGEVSGWETSTWDQLGKGDSSHYEEFENVMRWDDSGAREAFEIAKKIEEGSFKGSTSSLLLPSPDLYIQVIDWDSREDLKLPDSAETFSQHGERSGQRKRGRRGGAFRRQFDRQDFMSTADQNQNFVCYDEAKPQGDQALYHNASNAPVLDGPLDVGQKDDVPCQWQSPVQDQVRSTWSARWSSQPHQRQNLTSSKWQDRDRRDRDEGHYSQTHQSHHRWQQTNVSFEPVRGWGRGGVPYHSSHGLLYDPHYQSMPATHISNPGNEWMCQGEANGRGSQQHSITHLNRGPKEQHRGPGRLPDNSCRWRQQQQQSYHPWQ